MAKYIYNNQHAAPYDTVEATYQFTDVDGNQVEGSYSHYNLLSLFEIMGDVLTEEFHPTVNKNSLWMNGIVDINKTIHITIRPYSAPV